MTYLLDTNAVIAILNQNTDFIQRLKQHSPADFALSAITWFELHYGAHKSQKTAENLAKLEKLAFDILPFSQQDAQTAGKIRSDLAKQGKPIGSYDTLIAAQALSNQLVLITHNVREFERVEGLVVEDWEKLNS